MITVLQILVVLLFIVVFIIIVFKPRRNTSYQLPDHYKDLLQDYVAFYNELKEDEQKHFHQRLEKFYASVKITGVNAEVEDIDRVLIGVAAIIPVFYIRDWEYVHLKEVLVYPGNFNIDFDQAGNNRSVLGMVGTGALQNVMILSKWELRQNFITPGATRNTAIHEFAHLIDKMDGTFDGIPEILLERKYLVQWNQLMSDIIMRTANGTTDIDVYATTNQTECFAVLCEYYFTQQKRFSDYYPEIARMLQQVFRVPN
jgi:Mlc titration factor MtfA (ptsG expression regulator)